MTQPDEVNVLIVDDEPEICDFLSFDFKAAGFNTLIAKNGTEALKIVQNQHIDVIVSDIRMAQGDGVQLLDKIKGRDVDSPILLFMTAFSDHSLEDLFNLGAEAVFTKPVKSDNIISVIRSSMLPKSSLWKRKFHRLDVKLNVEINAECFEHAHIAEVISLGRGGMFFATNQELPKLGDIISFRVTFDDAKWSPISGTGITRWVRREKKGALPLGFGLEFMSMSPDSLHQVLELVNAIRTRAFIPKK